MRLCGRWNSLVGGSESDVPARVEVPLSAPLDLERASKEVRVCDGGQAADLLRDLRSTPLAALGLAIRSEWRSEAVSLRSGRVWQDIRSLRPRTLAVAAWARGELLIRAVVPFSEAAAIDALLRLSVPLAVHGAGEVLFGLWAAGLDPELLGLYDTRLAAACLHLGEDHPRAGQPAGEAPVAARVELEARRERLLSLEGQCEAYGLLAPFSGGSDPRALASRAEAVVRIYVAQQNDLLQAGLQGHLHRVEFPFAVANARMEWRGVRVDPERLGTLRQACRKAAEHHIEVLRGHGVEPPGSREAFLRSMRQEGLQAHLKRHGVPSTEDQVLKDAERLHPAIRAYRLQRRYGRIATEEWTSGALVGADGRVHPEHRQLAAATGRNGCRSPNLTGIGRALRPVVVAPPGRGLVELDYSQIEVGIAAAEHGDADLIEAFNSGDVYAAVAQRFYAGDLSAEERVQDPLMFRRTRPELRERMKLFVLATLYGSTARGLALRLGVPEPEARREMDRFLGAYPALARGLEEAVAFGRARGDAAILSGLRRRVDPTEGPSGWIRNVLRNTPIQGGATVVFKQALIQLDQVFRGTETWLVMQVHDSVLIECPLGEIDAVARRAERVMVDAVHAYYPSLRPRVSVNKARPECWNHDGHADSLERFLEDPDYEIGRSERVVQTDPDVDAFTSEVLALFGGTLIEGDPPWRRMAPFHEPGADPGECRVCGSRAWWRRNRGGPRVCAKCHPSVHDNEHVERWEAGGGAA